MTKAAPKKNMGLEVGFWAALVLDDDVAPVRCYVGRVEAIDVHGVRVTLMDWIAGDATSWDFFVAWTSLRSALVATPAHDLDGFLQRASGFQTEMNKTVKAAAP